MELATSLPDAFSTLVSLVASAGLVAAMSSPGPLTVFAPTNDAFEMIGQEMLDMLGSHPDLLFALLSYHVVPELVRLSDLALGAVETSDGRF